MSQNKQILEHLQKGHGISSMLAFKKFGCTRISARIKDLRDAGHSITDRWIEHGNKRYKLYSLSK